MTFSNRNPQSFSMLDEAKVFALSALEELCNRALRYDDSSRLALAELAGQELAVRCDLPFSTEVLEFFISFNEEGLILKAISEDETDASIEVANLKVLAEFFSGRYANAGAGQKSERLIIRGNLDLVEQLQNILSELDIDWEEPLSRIVGDVAAHEIHRVVDDAGELIKKAGDFIENDLMDGLNQLSARFFKRRNNKKV